MARAGERCPESEEQLDEYEDRFEELALELGAEYDGYHRD